MALSDILNKITEETDKKLKKLEQEFNEKKDRLKKQNEESQKKLDESLHKKIEESSAKIIEKAENLAEMESKNLLLKAKREILEESLGRAIEALAQSEKYTEIITEMLKKSDIEGDNIVVVPAKGKESETKDAIKNSGKPYFLSEKSTDIKGGIIIKTSNIEIDNSFETIIKEELRETLEMSINKILFS